MAPDGTRRRPTPGTLCAPFAMLLWLSACGGAAVVEDDRRSETHVEHVEDVPQSSAAESRTPPVLLWQVTAGAADEPSWILASLSFGADLSSALPAPHDRVLERAGRIVADVDPAALELPALYDAYRLGRHERLDRMLGAPAWVHLRSEVGALLPEATLRQIRPWVLALHFTRVRMAEAEASPASPATGAGSTSNLTRELIERARASGRPTEWLDPDPATHVADLERLPGSFWILALREALEAPEAVRARLVGIRDAYRSRHEGRVREACAAPSTLDADAPGHTSTLIATRVQRWLPEVERQLRRGGALVAVDACILLAENGLLAALYGTGLRIRRLGGAPEADDS